MAHGIPKALLMAAVCLAVPAAAGAELKPADIGAHGAAGPPVVPSVPTPVAPAIAVPQAAAQGDCLQALAASAVSFSIASQPSNLPACQVESPVRLQSFSINGRDVRFPDRPVLACHFAVVFTAWLRSSVAPMAERDLQSALTAIGTGPGFDCRGRNGDSSAKMSEHALGDAADISFLTLSDKRQVVVKDAADSGSPSFTFLRDVRADACKVFATVLGPGSNPAHAEHFHVDLEPRSHGDKICE